MFSARRLHIEDASRGFVMRNLPVLIACCLGVLVFLSVSDCWAYNNAQCIRCHRQGSRKSDLFIPVGAFKASAHGGMDCVDCHTEVKDEAHMSAKRAAAVNCGQCHEQKNLHGMRETGRSVVQCYECHTKHAILPKSNPNSSIYPARLKKTCAGCHPVETGKTGYLAWLLTLQIKWHKKADFSKAYSRYDCVGCHQGQAAHGELRAVDAQTCGVCHLPKKGRAPLWITIHPRASLTK